MRGLGCLFVALIALAVGGFFLDQAVTSAAERQTAQRVSQAMDADATVEFEGWPVTLRMLGGRIPQATVSAIDVPLDRGGRLDSLDIVLTDVRIDLADLQSGGSNRLPPARRGTFQAELGESSIKQAAGVPDAVGVRLEDGLVTVGAGGLEVDANVEPRNGDIIVSIAGPLERLLGSVEFPIDLSDEPGAPAVRAIEIDDGVMRLSGVLEAVRR